MLSEQWIAGFFDGEGSVGIYTNGRGIHYLKVQVVQGDTPISREILNELQVRFGGSVPLSASRAEMGSISWQISSEKALNFLTAIVPYSVIKKSQIELVFNWWETRKCDCPKRLPNGTIARSCYHKNADVITADLLKKIKKERSVGITRPADKI